MESRECLEKVRKILPLLEEFTKHPNLAIDTAFEIVDTLYVERDQAEMAFNTPENVDTSIAIGRAFEEVRKVRVRTPPFQACSHKGRVEIIDKTIAATRRPHENQSE